MLGDSIVIINNCVRVERMSAEQKQLALKTRALGRLLKEY